MGRQLPDCRQRKDWSCGEAFLEAIHIVWNKPLKPALRALTNPVQGLGPDAADAALRASGFSVLSGHMNIDILRSLTKAGYPVGCLGQFDGGGHWMLVGHLTPQKVHLLCPIRGLISQSIAEWDANWIDFHWAGGEFRRWGTCPSIQE